MSNQEKLRTNRVIHIKTVTPYELTTGKGASITDEDGRNIPGVKAVQINMGVDRATTAEVTLFSSFDAFANAKFVMHNPNTGKLAEIKTVRFTDNTHWEAQRLSDATTCDTEGHMRKFVVNDLSVKNE